MKTKKNIAIFGDISMNGIDGSSIWLQSISCIFPKDKFNVYLILRDKIVSTVLLNEIKNVNFINVYENKYIEKKDDLPCSPYELFTILRGLDKDFNLDHIIIRAPRYLKELVGKIENPTYRKIVSKIDAYFPKINIYKNDYEKDIIGKALPFIARIIVQTEEMRSYFDMEFPDFIGKIIVLNPIVPDFKPCLIKNLQQKLKTPTLIYAGKLDKQYYVEEFVDVLLLNNDFKYKLKYVGSKVTTSKEDSQFGKRIREKLAYYESKKNFLWLKQLDRKATIQQIANATFMLSVRQDVYDTSNEVSTKLLEAMSVGTLPLLKKTAANVKLLGLDYPGYISDLDKITELVKNLIAQPKLYIEWSKKIQNIAKNFTFSNTYNFRLKNFYENNKINYKPNGVKKKLLIASHDNKFFTKVISNLSLYSDFEIKFDNWSTTLKHDAKKSKQLLEWADIIICEWAVGPAVYYSNNKLDHQKLLVRLHRFEITTDQPNLINFDNVNNVIVVSDYIKKHCIENYSWDANKIQVIPQYADLKVFDRPKLEISQYNLGLLGAVPTLKRLDRALDIIESLRKLDERYMLYIKSKHPWEIPFVWNKPNEREFFIEQYERIEGNPILKNGVIFDEYGPDVSSWFRKIGWMLSTSDIEGCHTAVAEAMASGAKPIIFDWPGSEGVYRENPIFSKIDDAVQYILLNKKTDTSEISRIKKYAHSNFDLDITLKAYYDFLNHDGILEVNKA